MSVLLISSLCVNHAVAVITDRSSSSTFPYRYEGDAPGAVGNPGNATGFGSSGYTGNVNGYDLTSDGNILTVTETAPSSGAGGVIYLGGAPTPNATWNSQATHANGWSWEIKIKVNGGQFDLRIGDSDGSEHQDIFTFTTSAISSRINGTLAGGLNLSSAFHVIRIAQPAGSGEYHVYLNQQANPVAVYPQQDTGLGASRSHWFSDGSGSSFGEYQVDYWRWTPGGFAPEEPAQIIESFGFTTVQEGGGGDSYDVRLNVNPVEAVNVTATPDNNEVSLNGQPAGQALALQFLPSGVPGQAPAPQTVTLSAVDDTDVEGSHQTVLSHALTSGDPEFDTAVLPDVSVSIIDNDSAPPPNGDSESFTFKYEGDAPAVNGNPASGFGNTGYSGGTTGYTLASDGDILDVSIDTGHASPGLIVYLQSSDWVSNATDAAGWTWEARFRLTGGIFTLRIGDETDPHDIVTVQSSDGRIVSRIDGTLATLANITNDFHTYRIGQGPGSSEYRVWIDNVLVATYSAADTGIGTGGPHWWSDGSGGNSGEYLLDYVRWTSGLAAPGAAVLEISESGGVTHVTENGEVDSYTIGLSDASPPPAQNVTVTVTPSGQVRVNGQNQVQLVFPAGSLPGTKQGVTVSAVDNQTLEGLHVDTITHAVSSNDSAYDQAILNAVTVNITDHLYEPQAAYPARQYRRGPLVIEVGEIRTLMMHAKFPRLLQFPDGSLTALGFRESLFGQATVIRSDNGGNEWQPVQTVFGLDGWTASVNRSDGTSLAIAPDVDPVAGQPGVYQVLRWESTDNGETANIFSDGTLTLPSPNFDSVTELGFFGNVLEKSDGTLLAALHARQDSPPNDDSFISMLVQSADGGIHWTYVSTIATLSTVTDLAGLQAPGWFLQGPSEPFVCELPDGELVCVMRLGDPEANLTESMLGTASTTYADFWTTIAGPEMNAEILTLQADKYYSVGPAANPPLVMARSSNGGQTWGSTEALGQPRGRSPRMVENDGILALVYGDLSTPRWGSAVTFSLDGGHNWLEEIVLGPFFTTGYTQIVSLGQGRFLALFDVAGPQPWIEHESHWIGMTEINVTVDPNRLVGDFDYSGRVDVDDLRHFNRHWLEDDCFYPLSCGAADIDRSELVELRDFEQVSSSWLAGDVPFLVKTIESGGQTRVSEDGAISDTYQLVLGQQPVSSVFVSVIPDAQVSLPATALAIFDAGNWNTPQTITVAAIDDTVGEGTHRATIQHSVFSTDPVFNGTTVPSVELLVSDNDGFAYSPMPGRVEQRGNLKITLSDARLLLRGARTPLITQFSDNSIIVGSSSSIRSTDGGQTWRPVAITWDNFQLNSVEMNNGQTLILRYNPSYLGGDNYEVTRWLSNDNGLTATGPFTGTLTLPQAIFGSNQTVWFNQIIRDEDSADLFGVMQRVKGPSNWQTVLVKSVNNGQDWTYVAIVADDTTLDDPQGRFTQWGWPLQYASEPTIASLGGGKLVVMARVSADDDAALDTSGHLVAPPSDDFNNLLFTAPGERIWPGTLPSLPREKFYRQGANNVPCLLTFSDDNGQTWTPAIPMDHARGVFPRVAVSSDDIVALGYGSLAYPRHGHGIVFSSDGGQSWTDPVEFAPFMTTGYTQLISTGPGKFLSFFDSTWPTVWGSDKERWIGMIEFTVDVSP